mgnify:CR=1 FL=1
MKKIRKLLLVTLAAALCALLLTGCGEKEVSVSVTLVNHSGHDISSISITPSTSTEWDTEFVDGTFADGESFSAGLGTYKESEVPDTYNIIVYNSEDTILYDTSVDELDFTIQDGDYIIFLPPEGDVPIEIAHDYDPADYELDYAPTGYTEEELSGGDLSGYTIKATKSVEVQVLREKFATKNMIGVLAFGEYDAKITDSKKVSSLTMAAS